MMLYKYLHIYVSIPQVMQLSYMVEIIVTYRMYPIRIQL